MMKKFLLLGAMTCAILSAAASAAIASPTLMVTGAGASEASGQVVVQARATQPGLGSPAVPAVGFLRAPAAHPPYGDQSRFNFSGRVTCIADWLGSAAATVSGTLDTPLFSASGIVPDFTLTVRDFGTTQYLEVWPNTLGATDLYGPMCGIEYFFAYPGGFFDPELEQLRQTLLVERGHFTIHGPFNLG